MDTDILRKFYDRRHPLYWDMLAHWNFLQATYDGGRDWFSKHIFAYHKEGDTEFKKRVDRAYRFNHTRECVDLVQKYLFKGVIARNKDEAPDVVKNFWKSTTLQGLSISQFMRAAAAASSIKGRVAIVIDNNAPSGPVTLADAMKANIKIYAYTVDARDILDYAYDEDGDGGLLWIKLREFVRDDADPVNSSGDVSARVRLWTRTGWTLYAEKDAPIDPRNINSGQEASKVVTVISEGTHALGRVPVILLDHIITDEPYKSPGLIDDIAYLDRAVANYLSNLDAIIQDQTFSQLAMPAQGLLPGEDTYDKLVELGTKRIFVYDAGAGSTGKPEYLSPDPKQAGVILTVINKIINEIYHTIGLAGERTKEDNAVGIDNSSGVAKAYDFERVNSLLTSKGQACEKAENEMIELVCLWAGEKTPKDNLVKYPETYDVMRLADDLAVAEQLAKIDAPKEIRREQMRGLSDKLFARLAEDIRKKIEADIQKWPPEIELSAPPSSFGAKPATAKPRQGQVTQSSPNKQGASASQK